jgi:hypothetical protein
VCCEIASARIYGLLPVPLELPSQNAFEQAELFFRPLLWYPMEKHALL